MKNKKTEYDIPQKCRDCSKPQVFGVSCQEKPKTCQKIVPPEVKNSTFGCMNCLWHGIECKNGGKYNPEIYTDSEKANHYSCGAYTYYD